MPIHYVCSHLNCTFIIYNISLRLLVLCYMYVCIKSKWFCKAMEPFNDNGLQYLGYSHIYLTGSFFPLQAQCYNVLVVFIWVAGPDISHASTPLPSIGWKKNGIPVGAPPDESTPLPSIGRKKDGIPVAAPPDETLKALPPANHSPARGIHFKKLWTSTKSLIWRNVMKVCK